MNSIWNELYNAALQGKAEYLGIIMGGIPKSIYDKKKGIFSYEAMRSRLSTGSYQDSNIVNMMTPIIKVLPLTARRCFAPTMKRPARRSDTKKKLRDISTPPSKMICSSYTFSQSGLWKQNSMYLWRPSAACIIRTWG